METIMTILVTFFAGMGAGLGTGFAGMSAAAVISPMLITFLGIDPYMAVGIALSSDVLASAVSAYTYHKNKNIQPYKKNGQIQWPPHELLHGSLEFQFFIHKFILTYKSSGTFYIVTGKIRLCQIV